MTTNITKKSILPLALSAFAMALCSAGATAQEAKPASALEVSGRVWAQLRADMTKDSGHKSGFDISRAFLQAQYKFNAEWSTVLLLDAARTGATPDYLASHVRNAYVQHQGLLGDGSLFRFGLQPTFYVATLDGAVKTRWLGKNLVDEGGVVPSQDGAASLTAQAGSVLRYGVAVRNGREGLSKAGSSDNALGYDAFATITPFDGALEKLGLTVYDSLQSQATGSTATASSNTLAVALHSQHAFVDASLETVVVKQSGAQAVGYGVTANVKPSENSSIYARFFSGNTNFQTGKLKSKSVLTVGPTYAFVAGKLSTALLFETRPAVTAGASAQNALLWNWAANF